MLEIRKIDLGYTEYQVSKESIIITNKVGDGLTGSITKCMSGKTYWYILSVESSIHSYSIKQKYYTETPVDMEVRAQYIPSGGVNIVFNDNTNNVSICFKYSKKMYIPSTAVDLNPMNAHSYGDMINDFTNRHMTCMTAQ